jgi:large subunit ribosomal protein L4
VTPSIDVVTQANAKTGTVELDPSVFGVKPRPHLFHAEVRRQLATRRAGTHSTKNRSAVSGGGIKPWKQKGTGRARQGSIRAPQWAGGGVVFGPVPRSHAHDLNKKTRRAALVAALSLRAGEGALRVVSSLALGGIKTKKMVEVLKKLGLGDASVLLVLAERDEQVERSARNLPRVTVIRAEGVNVYDVLRHSQLLVTRAALDALQARLAKPAGEKAGAKEARA